MMKQQITNANLLRVAVFLQGLKQVSIAMLQKQFRMSSLSAANTMDELIKHKFIDKKRIANGCHAVMTKEIEIYVTKNAQPSANNNHAAPGGRLDRERDRVSD